MKFIVAFLTAMFIATAALASPTPTVTPERICVYDANGVVLNCYSTGTGEHGPTPSPTSRLVSFKSCVYDANGNTLNCFSTDVTPSPTATP